MKNVFHKFLVIDSSNVYPNHIGPDAFLVRHSGTFVPGPRRAVPDSILHDNDQYGNMVR